jgi:hypothetical protein
MIRRFFLSVFFGALTGIVALRQSGQAAGVMAGILSAAGFWIISSLLRARALRRQGKIPFLWPGEEALLYGPCEVYDATGSSRAWAYLSNQRLLLRDEEGGAPLDLALKDIEELRPDPAGVVVVSKIHGLLKLKLPDPKRWLETLRQAVRS